jgi:hypothetical protein
MRSGNCKHCPQKRPLEARLSRETQEARGSCTKLVEGNSISLTVLLLCSENLFLSGFRRELRGTKPPHDRHEGNSPVSAKRCPTLYAWHTLLALRVGLKRAKNCVW